MNYKKEIIDKKNLVNTFDDKVNNKRKAKDIIKNEILDINIIFHNKHKQEKKGLELNKTNLNVKNLTPTTELNSNIKFNIKKYTNILDNVKDSQDNIINNKISSINNIKNSIIKYTDSEINGFSYEKALKCDKRTYIQYYISLLKTKHLLIFTFYPMKDYNSMI